MITCRNYPVKHGDVGGSGGNTYIRGGNANIPSDLVVNSITANRGNIQFLEAKSLSANDAGFIYITTEEGIVQKISGNSLKYNTGYIGEFASDTISTGKLTADDIDVTKAWIETLNSKYITTEYLTVTRQAHFFELIIDKIRSVGGQIIITPASCIVDYVQAFNASNNIITPTENNINNVDHFRVFWRNTATDGSGRAVTNDFIVNDQAICQSFNNVSTGVNYDVSNKYYWRLVKKTSNDSGNSAVYVNFNTGEITSDANKAVDNNIYIAIKDYLDVNENLVTGKCFFKSKAQTLEGIDTGVRWSNYTDEITYHPYGVMSTHSTLFGVQIDAVDDPNGKYERPIIKGMDIALAIVDKDGKYSGNSPFASDIAISVVFTDNTYMYFSNITPYSSTSNTAYLYFGEPNAPIKSITIVYKKEVDWHLCNWMDISNKSGECAKMLNGFASIPSAGDNIVQLGYQGSDDPNRQSAIIIAAYNHIDKGDKTHKALVAPSYAQYKGINNFDLSSHRHSYFDANGAQFIGDISLSTVNGDLITNVIDEIAEHSQKYSTKIISDTTQILRYEDKENPGTYLVSPTKFKLNMLYYKDGNAYNSTKVLKGYRVYIQYFDEDNNEYTDGRIILGEGASLRGNDLTGFDVINSYIKSGANKYIKKIRIKLCEDKNGTTINNAPLIEILDISYVDSAVDGINGADGADGADGKDGEDGADGELYYLIAEREAAYAGIISAYQSSSNVNLYASFVYKIGHTIGSLFEVLDISSTSYKISITAYAQKTDGSFASIWNTTSKTGSYASDNILEIINPTNQYVSGEYRDYMECYEKHRDRCPIYFLVQLKDNNNKVIDEHYVYVNLQSGSVLKITDEGIVTAVTQSNAHADEKVEGLKTYVTNNYSTTEQTATQIKSTVDSSLVGYATQEWTNSQISQSADQIKTTVSQSYYNKDDIDSMLGEKNSVWEEIDLTNTSIYIESNFYPVSVKLDTDIMRSSEKNKLQYVFQVDRALHKKYKDVSTQELEPLGIYWGCPSWGNSQDGNPRGVDLICNWSTILSKWGEYNIEQYVNNYSLRWTATTNGIDNETKVIGSLQQYEPNSEIIFYLRGGSRYNIRYDHTGFHATLHATDYTAHPGNVDASNTTWDKVYPVLVGANNENLIIPTKDRLNYSEIQQTARSISLSVYDEVNVDGVTESELRRTGIDITTGNITLSADKTTVEGGSMAVKTGSGIVFYDTNGIPKINIHADDLNGGSFAGGTYKGTFSYNSQPSQMLDISNGNGARTGVITYSWPLKTEYSLLGRLTKGSVINLSKINGIASWVSGDFYYYSENDPYILMKTELLYDNEVISTVTNKIKHIYKASNSGVTVNTFAGTEISNLTYTVPEGKTTGVYTVRATLDLNGASIRNSYLSVTKLFASWNIDYVIDMQPETGTNGLLEMANNGINYTVSGDSALQFKDDDFLLTTGYSGIKMNGTNKVPIQRYVDYNGNGTTSWGALGTQMRINTNANAGSLSYEYDVYVITGAGPTNSNHFYLNKDSSQKGRVIYIIAEVQTTLHMNGCVYLANDTSDKTLGVGLHTLICYAYSNNKYHWTIL